MRKYLCKRESRKISHLLGSMRTVFFTIRNEKKAIPFYKSPYFWIKFFFMEKDMEIKLMRMRSTMKKARDLGFIAEQDWEKLELKRQAILKGERI